MNLLTVDSLTAFYGDFQALFGLDLVIAEGETVAVIGANGAGKSTFLKCVCGLVAPPPASIRFGDQVIAGWAPHQIVRAGIALVPEGRRLFPSLSIEENLRLGAYGRRPGPWSLRRVFDLFPVLEARRTTAATALSGGQQQMVAIGRALMSNPRLLLCDEVSLGLAPAVIKTIYEALPGIVAEGTSVLVVEQDISQALKIADRVYCFQEGRISLAGAPAAFTREAVATAYFGV